jgi:Skp family chaperone for outer membrane proteins
MLELDNLTIDMAVTNHGGTMEADTILKTRASLKSHKSRSNFLFTIIAIIVFSIIACSPESNGKKVAKEVAEKICECEREYEKAYQKFIEKEQSELEKWNFQTRAEVSEKNREIQRKLDALRNQQDKCSQKSEEIYRKAREKYATNQQKKSEFEYAYSAAFGNYYRSCRVVTHSDNSLWQPLNNIRLSIIPPKPDVDRLKNDLIGRLIDNQTTGYPNWKINSLDELKDLELLNTTDKTIKNGYEYMFDAHQILQGVANQWDANIKVKYVLLNNEDWWKLDTYNGQMNIVRTGKFDNCLRARKTAKTGYKDILELTNNCDVIIVVAGETQRMRGIGQTSDSPWQKFQISVSPNSKREYDVDPNSWLGGLYDYVIQFIEQGGL